MKKIIITAAAIAGVSALTAVQYSAQDLNDLSSSLLGSSEITAEQDVDGDGVVDSYDLVAMRKTFSGTGKFTEQTIDITEKNVRYIGRNFYDENNIAWLVQSGSAVEFTVTGKSAEITINGDEYTENEEKYRPRYAVLVDGEIILDELLDVKNKTVELFSDSASRTAVVKVIHLSEANNGAVGVSKLKTVSDVPVPASPTQKKDLQIEFIGDSITCAYGVEGKNEYESFSTATENFMKSYAYLTAQQLDSDYSAVSYSGHGIISGYSQTGDKETGSLVPDYYEYVGKANQYQKPWDFDSHKYDAVVINLGTNDNTYVSKDIDTRGPEFTAEYEKFLALVHEKNPEAYIICTLGTMGCTEEFPYIEAAVENFKKSSGYDRIMCYQSATHTQADGLGSDWHPSLKTQQNSAYVLADKICQALGMESDQIGIDVASVAEYSTVSSDGAMMSDYFSNWDKSYHITTVTGGTKKESIQSFVSGIDIKKGGKYRISFCIETSDGAEIPFVIRSKSTGEIIFEDTFMGTGDKSPFEAEFESPITADSELVFSLGGTDSLRMSLYELKVVKFS